MGMVRKGFGNVPFKDLRMERKRVEEFEVRKGFGNVPLKDLIIERKRVEKFEESLCEDYG